MVERALAAEVGRHPGLAEVLARVAEARAGAGGRLEDLPAVMVEEVPGRGRGGLQRCAGAHLPSLRGEGEGGPGPLPDRGQAVAGALPLRQLVGGDGWSRVTCDV